MSFFYWNKLRVWHVTHLKLSGHPSPLKMRYLLGHVYLLSICTALIILRHKDGKYHVPVISPAPPSKLNTALLTLLINISTYSRIFSRKSFQKIVSNILIYLISLKSHFLLILKSVNFYVSYSTTICFNDKD